MIKVHPICIDTTYQKKTGKQHRRNKNIADLKKIYDLMIKREKLPMDELSNDMLNCMQENSVK